jgi:FkbM family methyltransferase
MPTTALQPILTSADGSRLPPPLRAARGAAIRGPEVVRRGLARVMTGRLPELVARYPDGRAFRVPAGDVNYDRVFFWGEYDRDEAALLRRLLRPGDAVADVGAHLGWYAVLLGSIVGPHGWVIAFEPLEPTRRQLEANLALNPGAPVRVVPCALGAEPGDVDIHVFAGLPHGHASVSALGRDDYVTHRVRRSTLDAELAGDRPALLKLDAEGAELDVLRGAAATLRGDAAPIVLVEVNRETAAAVGYEPADLAAELRRHHPYELFRVQDGALVPEREPAIAHGVTWVAVPPARRDRV